MYSMKEHEVYADFVMEHFERNRKTVSVAGSFIAVFEWFFAIYVIIRFFPNVKFTPYLVCYIVLFLAASLSLWLLSKGHSIKSYKTLMYLDLHLFDSIISIWAIVISFMDISRGGYPIVFVTVMFSLPFFLVLNPLINFTYIIAGTVTLVTETYLLYPDTTFGYAMNLGVFAVMAILINQMCYSSNQKNYRLEKQLLKSSMHDGLTGLFNRSALDSRLEQLETEQIRRSVIMLDCDYFKKINDTMGHRFGDACLEKIAKLLSVEFGNDCYRYGGDEFLIISELTNERMQAKLAQVNSELKEEFKDIRVSITAGIYNIDGECKASDMLQRADEALYNAKETKRGTSVVYTPERSEGTL